MSKIEKIFPEYFDRFKMPDGAHEEMITVYRACKTGKCDEVSFIPSFEENGYKLDPNVDEKEPGQFSLSTYEKPKDVKRFASVMSDICIPYRIAIGKTIPEFGLVQRTRERTGRRTSHVDWWLYKGAKPHTIFLLIENFEEYLRLLYVALTRAKNNLIVVGEVDLDNLRATSDELDVLHSKTFMELILNSFENTEINKIRQDAVAYFGSNIVVHNVKCDEINFNTEAKKLNNIFYNLEENIDDKKIIENVFNFKYKNYESTKLCVKNTVSELNSADEVYSSYNYAPKKLVIEENNILPPNKKGTLYHLVMQNIDFDISTLEEVENELNNMISKGLISQLEYENINQTQILNCVLNLKDYIRHNSIIYKEQPFVMLENYNNVVDSIATDEVLVQGVIDLIIQNDDVAYVIDYKTTLGNEKHLLELYSTQLRLYALSVEHALKIDNVKILIYSFELNKFIEIN